MSLKNIRLHPGASLVLYDDRKVIVAGEVDLQKVAVFDNNPDALVTTVYDVYRDQIKEIKSPGHIPFVQQRRDAEGYAYPS